MPTHPPRTAPMFFFGTLMDEDVLAAVLGHPAAAGRMEPARLVGWRRTNIAGRTYPMLIPHPTGTVEGVLVHGLDERDRRRLDHYEGPEYRVGCVQVRTGGGNEVMADSYLCPPGVPGGREEWRLETWRLRHKRAALTRIRALMAGWRD
ncbi:putative avirulence induced gene (AIG) protein(AIG2-like,11-111) [Magnetospirillum sp. XM-1]|uniref:gamma-glutamylcyclotransferase family protein n=1 Tax=Magnetospirillum sp. XM-1 TaxID=1663591 RepID=UPI00073DEB10|nr:gamma-glutamylcyclotransferase family protein [Magnetospirillum sp. XM-1]CUW38421.1 putative avirulence induced gene (AIG) protein(AIG2-like,11-111) [Magnetospirillum sp. XM-1]